MCARVCSLFSDSILDSPSIPTNPLVVDALPSTNNFDDSVDLDLSLSHISKPKITSPDTTESVDHEEFVPAKGQKGAAQRLNKLKSKRRYSILLLRSIAMGNVDVCCCFLQKTKIKPLWIL